MQTSIIRQHENIFTRDFHLQLELFTQKYLICDFVKFLPGIDSSSTYSKGADRRDRLTLRILKGSGVAALY